MSLDVSIYKDPLQEALLPFIESELEKIANAAAEEMQKEIKRIAFDAALAVSESAEFHVNGTKVTITMNFNPEEIFNESKT